MECETPTQPPIVIEVAPEPMKSTPAIESTANENDVEDSAVPSDFVNRGKARGFNPALQHGAFNKLLLTSRNFRVLYTMHNSHLLSFRRFEPLDRGERTVECVLQDRYYSEIGYIRGCG